MLEPAAITAIEIVNISSSTVPLNTYSHITNNAIEAEQINDIKPKTIGMIGIVKIDRAIQPKNIAQIILLIGHIINSPNNIK